MSDRIFIKPAAGRAVINPSTGALVAAKGEWIDRDTYWIRRLDDRDVVEAESAKPTRQRNVRS